MKRPRANGREAVQDLLRRASWQAEKLFKRRGSFGLVWLAESEDGRWQMFEAGCTAEHVDDRRALDGLREELRDDFAPTVVRYAVAYLAKATTVEQPTLQRRNRHPARGMLLSSKGTTLRIACAQAERLSRSAVLCT